MHKRERQPLASVIVKRGTQPGTLGVNRHTLAQGAASEITHLGAAPR